MEFEERLFPITTIIKGKYNDARWTASGFFYHNFSESIKGGWHKLKKTYLVTNRHVVFHKDNDKEKLAESLIFNFRSVQMSGIEWLPIELSNSELKKRLLLHKWDAVDVVVIDVSDYFGDLANNENTNNAFCVPVALSNINLPQYQKINIEVTSDVVVASYPRGFYDNVNKFPIVKSGIIASAYGFNFKGRPMFQIDAQLFPGSSGGLVISKPTNYTMIGGKPAYSADKQFVLLGIYSGEYFFKDVLEYDDKECIDDKFLGIEKENGKYFIKRSYGLGNVWYSSLIQEIIDNGVKIN